MEGIGQPLVKPNNPFEPDLVYEFFKDVWAKEFKPEDELLKEDSEDLTERDTEIVERPAESSKKTRTTANPKAVKVACELLRLFVAETIHRAALLAEAEGSTEIVGSHLERILPQLLNDF